jgi:diguanylate cyclase (GGDEF)-like protein
MVLGIVGSALAAVSVDRNGAMNSRRAFRSSSAEIALTLQIAIQHERDLIVSASGFVISNPNATNAQFAAWARSVHALALYPELSAFGHSVVVPAAALPAFAARAVRTPAGPLAADRSFEVVPAGRRAFYCLSIGALTRTPEASLPAGYDFCAGNPGGRLLFGSRDSGRAVYLPIQAGEATLLSIITPVYRTGVLPATVGERRRAFLGWVGMSVMPQVVLAMALRAHPHTAVKLSYRAGLSTAVFRRGEAPNGAQSTTIALHNGWTVETFAAIAGGGVLAGATAWALLVGGIVLSGLLAALIVVLGVGRTRALRLVSERTGELRYRALHDGLTGLPNRVLTMDRVEHLLARCRRARTEGSVLYVDVDEFKNVNDTLGHAAGDELLVAVAARLTSTLREADTIGRMGGDEFIVLIDGGELAIAPELVAERLLDVMRQPFDLDGATTPLIVNTSIGLASGDRATAGELLRDADVALHQAKAAGKNRYQTFNPDLQQDPGQRSEFEFDLRSALEGEQFRLVYQPIYRLDDLTIVGVEALLRWQHPTRGLVQPDSFIPVLERTGQIREVGRWVLHKACEQMAAWHARGDTLDVSVNVAAAQLDSDAIVDHVRGAIAISGLEAASLIIEVTETALMRNPDATARRLQAIKDLGVRIAIDDFGTGYSSLAYLQQFPVDCLKIDRMFAKAITTSPASKALIGTLVQLGQDLGLKTLVEGVETPGQLEHLRRQHVDEVQGFLFSRPLDPSDLENQILAPSRTDAAPRPSLATLAAGVRDIGS